MDLTTTYLGMKLRNPFIAGASPLTEQVNAVRELEDYGAAAVVLPSLYEERMRDKPIDRSNLERLYARAYAGSLTVGSGTPGRSPIEPLQYLERLAHIKRRVNIPVMASMSCTALGDWIEYSRLIADAGADALELNIYFVPDDPALTSADIEQRVVDIVTAVRQRVTIPIAVKISPFYTALPHLIAEIARAGANGAVLFTRAYQPDIDVERRVVSPTLGLSHVSDQSELLLRLRWLAILSPWTTLSLALSGAVHTGLDAIKAIMSGAHAVQVVSSLLNAGPAYMESLIEQFELQMHRTRATCLGELRGCLNHAASADPGAVERAQYVTALHSWSTAAR